MTQQVVVRCSQCGRTLDGCMKNGMPIVDFHEGDGDLGDCPGSGVRGTLVSEPEPVAP